MYLRSTIMSKMKILMIIARILIVLCIPLFIFSGVIGIAFNSVALYEYGFDEYQVSESTGFADSVLTKAAKDLIAYFNSGEENLNIIVEKDNIEIELFTLEESMHMKDVKGLVRLDYGVLMGTFLYIGAFVSLWLWRKKSLRQLFQTVFLGSALTLVIMVALWLGSLWNFDQLFLQFHQLVFSNDFWSAQGYMLKLFPGGFWYDTTLFCALGMAAIAIITGGLAGVYLFITGKGLLFYRLMS